MNYGWQANASLAAGMGNFSSQLAFLGMTGVSVDFTEQQTSFSVFANIDSAFNKLGASL